MDRGGTRSDWGREWAPSIVFLVAATVAGLAFVVLTPPLRFPDEAGHFLRAVQVSNSLAGAAPLTPNAAILSAADAADFDHFVARTSERPQSPFVMKEILERITGESSAVGTAVRRVPAPQMVSDGVAYLPQGAGLWLAQEMGGGFVVSLWAARLAGLICSTALTGLAIRLASAGLRWTMTVAALVPMAVYLRASASDDSLINAIALLAIAAFLRGAQHDGRLVPAVAVPALLACCFLAVAKPPYLCILLLGLTWLVPVPHNPSTRRRNAGLVAGLSAIALLVAWWHIAAVSEFASALRPGVDPSRFAAADKLRMLVTQPYSVAAVFAHTIWATPGMIYSGIARFGHLDINPFPLLHAGVVIWCFGTVYGDRRAINRDMNPPAGALMLLTFAAQFFVVLMTLWLMWTDTSSPLIVGAQGRYLLPALACGLLPFALLWRNPKFVDSRAGVFGSCCLATFVSAGALVLLGGSVISAVLGEFFGIQGFPVICLHEGCAAK